VRIVQETIPEKIKDLLETEFSAVAMKRSVADGQKHVFMELHRVCMYFTFDVFRAVQIVFAFVGGSSGITIVDTFAIHSGEV